MIRAVVVDDQALIRAGVRVLLQTASDVEVIGEAADGREAVRLVERLRPDVVLMDIRMAHVDGIEATRRILAMAPQTNVLMLTTFAEDDDVYGALNAGAVGFLVKDGEPSDMIDAVRRAARGEPLLAPRPRDRRMGGSGRLHGELVVALVVKGPTRPQACPGRAGLARTAEFPPAPAAVLTPYEGLGVGDAGWAAAAGGSMVLAAWRWAEYRALRGPARACGRREPGHRSGRSIPGRRAWGTRARLGPSPPRRARPAAWLSLAEAADLLRGVAQGFVELRPDDRLAA